MGSLSTVLMGGQVETSLSDSQATSVVHAAVEQPTMTTTVVAKAASKPGPLDLAACAAKLAAPVNNSLRFSGYPDFYILGVQKGTDATMVRD